jgi:predicted DNA repair protein MutK
MIPGMAGGSLLTLLDDIASILDDVSVMTKTAASKTAGVLGDDLALNAQQVSGVVAKRELPVVWSVAKGSFVNKLILVPAALVISAFAPWLVSPLLMVGGLYLCFEGVEKLVHQFAHKHEKTPEEAKQELEALKDGVIDEKTKIKGAIRTDFVLSAEIIAITLGVVAEKPFPTQVMTLSLIAILMTVGVYGLVAGIVKLDDLGLYLSQRTSAAAQGCGKAILWAAPFLMKLLSVLGTAAMFLVGGGIVTHGIHAVHHWIEHAGHGAGPIGGAVIPSLLNGLFGVVAGALVLLLVSGIKKLRGGKAH